MLLIGAQTEGSPDVEGLTKIRLLYKCARDVEWYDLF